MEIGEIGFLIGLIIVFFNILYVNNKIIEEIKKDSIIFFDLMKKEKNINIKNTALTLTLNKFNSDIEKSNKQIVIVLLFSIIGNTIFYFYLSSLFFYITFVLISILILSFSSIRANQIKFLNKFNENFK